MQTHTEGSEVSLTMPFELTLPSSATYTIKDELGADVGGAVVVPVFSEDTFVTFAIPAASNMLADKSRALRIVTLTVTDIDGNTATVEERYIVSKSVDLAVPGQSFQTVGQAILNTADIPNIDAFEMADDSNKRKAMFEAARRIDTMPFAVMSRNQQDYLEDISLFNKVEALQTMTPEQWTVLPTNFREALMRAQIVEADDILGGNMIEDQRRAGLMSHTVSESKHFYRPGKPMDTAVGKRAMRYLSEYLTTGMSVGLLRG